MDTIFDDAEGNWWYIWHGDNVGPFASKDAAEDAYEELCNRLHCPTGGCE